MRISDWSSDVCSSDLLSASVTGVHAGIAVATQPSHGAAAVSGDIVTYTPTAGYYGADSFTYTATGPGGTSTPATVTLAVATPPAPVAEPVRSEEHTSELQSLMRISYAGFCLKKKKNNNSEQSTIT